MKQNKTKKTVSFLLAGILFANTIPTIASAENLFSNIRDEIKSSYTVRTNDSLIGGGVRIRFKNTSNIKPIVMVSPPTASMSCNGVSMKSMWGNLLNIDDITAMFSDAGVSLIWGMMLSIQYTMPEIGAIFESVNDFARKIQNILRNACQTGVQIGQGLNKNYKFPYLDAVDNGIKTAKSYVDKARGGESIGKVLGLGMFNDDGNLIKDASGDSLAPEEQIERMAMLIQSRILKGQSMLGGLFISYYKRLLASTNPTNNSIVGILNDRFKSSANEEKSFPTEEMCFTERTSEFLQPISTGTDPSATVSNSPVSQLTGDGNDLSKMSANDRFAWFGYAIAYTMIGDIGIANAEKALNDPLARSTIKSMEDDSAGLLKTLTQYKNGDAPETGLTHVGGFSSPIAPIKIANFLLTGDMSEPSDTNASTAKIDIKVPCLTIVRIKEQGDNSDVLVYPVLSDTPKEVYYFDVNDDGEQTLANKPFEGTIPSAECVIQKTIAGEDIEVCNPYSLAPISNRYLKILMNTPTAERFTLREKLAQLIAYKSAESILASMLANVDRISSTIVSPEGYDTEEDKKSEGTTNSGATVSENSALITQGYIDSLTKSVLQARKELVTAAGFKDENELKAIDNLFDLQEQRNARRGYRALDK